VWVGIVLIGKYGLDPQRAGLLATLFLGAVVASSLFFAPRVNRIRGTLAAPAGFAIAAAAFLALATTTDYGVMAALHVLGGLAVGCGLSFTHSAIGASANPHRLIAIGFTALSVLAMFFLGGVPPLINALGGSVLFIALGAIMLAAALGAAFGFPTRAMPAQAGKPVVHAPLSRAVWFAMIGTSLMTLNQAMMYGFLERVGVAHGFSQQQVMGVLLAVGVVNLFPAMLAAVLERRVSARTVMIAGPAMQAVLALVITQTMLFGAYAVAASIYVSVLIFTHTFIFAFLARNDTSTRAVAATPVMAMAGSALGPVIGGVVAQNLGYSSIGWAVACVAMLGVLCFWQAERGGSAAPRTARPAH
jgi:predicted MFS family arabinose efflux permease